MKTKSTNKKNKEFKKDLGLLVVFSIASGAMISSGLFVLPSIIYLKAGPSIILGYIFASLLVVPAMFAQTELATAMPKAGGTYFFIHRSFGSLFGTFAGLANWFSISLKSAFALVGIGIFLEPLVGIYTQDTIKIIALSFTIFFTILNILSVKESGKFQFILVTFLLFILSAYIFLGFNHIDINNYTPFKIGGYRSIYTITGMIFISYGGLTKIASIAEEVKNPGKTLPKGMFLAFFIVSIIYVLVVFVTVGILNKTDFSSTLTPISEGALRFSGQIGYILLMVAGLLAFLTTANAGLLSASRTPMAMAKDNLLPDFFSKISSKFRTPYISIIFTSLFMILIIVFLDTESLVKVASTMMLILFAFVNISVILMRESKIVSYKPSYKAPLYPYLYVLGTIFYIALIIEMGKIPLIITGIFFIGSFLWYILYSKSRNTKESALIHIVERITSKEIKSDNLTSELRNILRQRDNIIEDRFDKIIKQAPIIDIENEISLDELFKLIANTFAKKFNLQEDDILNLLYERENDSTTAIHEGLAIPHIIVPGNNKFDIILIRSKKGIFFPKANNRVKIVFALAGTKDERNFHLQSLMAIAQIFQNKDFIKNWLKADTKEDLRNLILIAERIREGKI